jgi:GNAT superfamily N-acetyltransferase
MEVRPARSEKVSTYAAFGRAAQTWLSSRGLEQYVPAAHDEYAAAIRSKVEPRTLYAVWDGETVVGFFNLDESPSPWWPTDAAPALYLDGMVVSPLAHGRGVGSFILRWCMAETARRSRRWLRLDCHAGNAWLCGYYESLGFTLQGRVEQHPGYVGCLYQREVPPPARGSNC